MMMKKIWNQRSIMFNTKKRTQMSSKMFRKKSMRMLMICQVTQSSTRRLPREKKMPLK
jgi:hypothetical protein